LTSLSKLLRRLRSASVGKHPRNLGPKISPRPSGTPPARARGRLPWPSRDKSQHPPGKPPSQLGECLLKPRLGKLAQSPGRFPPARLGGILPSLSMDSPTGPSGKLPACQTSHQARVPRRPTAGSKKHKEISQRPLRVIASKQHSENPKAILPPEQQAWQRPMIYRAMFSTNHSNLLISLTL